MFISLVFATLQGYAGTWDYDTIDNWQVYNGTTLVFAGHDSPLGTVFRGTVKKEDLEDITIQFHHCARFIEDFEVTIDFTDRLGNCILTKKFRINSATPLKIARSEFGALTTDLIAIRYREDRSFGADRALGELRLQ